MRTNAASAANGKKGGRPRGTGPRQLERLTKEAAREYVRDWVIARLEPFLEAQGAQALGLKYLVTRDKKTGKFTRVTEEVAGAAGDEETERIEVWEKDPSTYAFTDLMNRALDKPKEQEIEVTVTTIDERRARLVEGRKRLLGP